MSALAGFCTQGHPLAPLEAETFGGGDLRIVRASGGASKPADWYARAARWCALGGFVPLSWREPVQTDDLLRLGAEAKEAIRAAIALCAGKVELAFRLERAAIEGEPAAASPGRAYLGALRREAAFRRDFLEALSAAAVAQGYRLSLTTTTPASVTGLLRCRASEVVEARGAVGRVAAQAGGARLSVSGALPPFGAGVELIERLGLDRARRAA